jgi:transposase
VNQAAVDDKGGGQGALTTEERAELTRLRRAVRTLEQERDFAKKCAAYFAKDKS